MPINVSNSAKAIKEHYTPVVNETVFYNDSLLGLKKPGGGRLFEVMPNPGDTSYRWKLHTTANDKIETFEEGAVHPEAGNQEYVNAALAYTYIWFVLETTGHARDALASKHFDIIHDNMIQSIDGMRDLFTTTFLNDSSVGLQAAIDNNNTYAGIARASASYFQSAVVTLSGTTTMSRTMFETALDSQHSQTHLSSRTGMWLFPNAQVTNYGQLPDFSTIDRRDIGSTGGKGFDLGWNWDGLMCHNAPVINMPDLTSSVILGLDTRPGMFKLVVRRPFQEKPLAPTGDNDRTQFSMGLAIPVRNPIRLVKIENIDA